MNWDAIGAVGETLGALLVGVTLIYLAIQIRSNTRVTKANASFQATHSWAEVNQRLAELPSDQFDSIRTMFNTNLTRTDMTSEEYLRVRLHLRTMFQKREGQYYLFKYGLLEPGIWEVRRSIGRGITEVSPLLREWWEIEAFTYSQEFINAINSAEPSDASKL